MSVPTVVAPPQPAAARPALGLWRRHVQNYELAWLSALFLALVIAGAVFAPWLTPYDPTRISIPDRRQLPSLAHPFGTDEQGRDIFARILFGARPILTVGVAAVLLALLVGVAIGTVAAYWGGQLDDWLMRLMDVVLSFPAILLAILIVAALGDGMLNLILAISFAMVPVFARLARAVVLGLVNQDYVLAARCLGSPDYVILRRHILPNMLPPILVQATAMLATAFSTSAALTFIGLGVEAPTPDWGLMVSEGQRLIFDAPHVPFFPGLVITLTIMSVNFVGDGLRDALDPVLRK
ncbi:MAG: ABC transporter permease [Chloroflexaceae bacterium]|nr:ABC transporter permease [Chloroflexaceae bacterium]